MNVSNALRSKYMNGKCHECSVILFFVIECWRLTNPNDPSLTYR